MKMLSASHKQSGFTLIELMMVMLIIGLMATVVAVSVGDGNRMLEFRSKAKQAQQLFEAAIEEAIFSRQQLGFYFSPSLENDTYQLQMLIYNAKERYWQPYGSAEFEAFDFLADTHMSLEIDDEPVILGERDEQSAIFLVDQELDDDKQIRPDIYVLSNGELPNFRLTFWPKEQPESQFELTGNMLGQLRLRIPGKDDEQE